MGVGYKFLDKKIHYNLRPLILYKVILKIRTDKGLNIQSEQMCNLTAKSTVFPSLNCFCTCLSMLAFADLLNIPSVSKPRRQEIEIFMIEFLRDLISLFTLLF